MEPKYPFPPLPAEIIMQIFEETARASHEGAHCISLVCQWARSIALRYLFATIVYRSKPFFSVTLPSGERLSSQSRPSGPLKWGHLVHDLWVESVDVANRAAKENLLLACPNLENLAIASSSLPILSNVLKSHALDHTYRAESAFLHRLRFITVITHSFRYDWDSLAAARLRDGSRFLCNITQLRMLNMKISSFCPHILLLNLTHLALPFLDLGNNFEQDVLRLPSGIIEHPSLRMIVLTVDEERWLTNPWYVIAHYPGRATLSPRETFRDLVQSARQRDDRLYVVLSPRRRVAPWKEWADAARRGFTIWAVAEETRANDSHGAGLPDSFPKHTFR
ncbi:hypothetical protein BD414DRAFT_472940 [Trametes punicea]|nr:hypothetical protein BD414DRAFT_472940 [Trametes punicea]